MRQTVVVVGGGYGGFAVAKALDEVADVVLVERKDAFVHNVAALRAVVDQSWLPRIFLPYDRLLRNGRVVHSAAVRVEAQAVTVASGERIVADFIVLATGSTYPFPAKSDVDSTEAAFEKYDAAHAALAGADRILLIGAGPVGLELAGEITSAWPDKRVTIVDQADDILAGPYKPQLRAELRSQLATRGVDLVLGAGLDAAPPTSPGVAGTFTAFTRTGVQITADVWLICYGVTPVTDYLAEDLAAARTPRGQLEVTEFLQLRGQDSVFALGDITAIAEPKMASRAGRHAEVVAANIRALINGDADLTAYQSPLPAILIPLGPDGGAAQLPGRDDIAGADIAAQYKGRDLFVDRFAETFGLRTADAT
jgi:apoptosis-inducing factor 2